MADREHPGGAAPATAGDRIPAVIVSHVDVRYKVYGVGRNRRPASSDNVIARWINRSQRHMGVREVHAVKDVSFVAYQGESIGIVGRNGSGKSTLLRAVAGLIPATGEVYHSGHAALLGVSAVLVRKLSGARNIFIGGEALGLSKQEIRAKYREIVEFAGIGDFINLPMSSYSSGMAARLRFSISTAAVPDILAVDEALGAGDADFRERAQERISAIREAAGTVFMVSHNNATIKAMCDRALWMEQGHLIMDGPTADVVDAYAKDVARRAAERAAANRAASKKAAAKNAKDTAAGGKPAKGKAVKGRAAKGRATGGESAEGSDGERGPQQ